MEKQFSEEFLKYKLLLDLIFSKVELNYDDTELKLYNTDVLMNVLKVIEPEKYEKILKEKLGSDK